jgi:GntR family transcriptional regulator
MLNPQSPIPLYHQLADILMAGIRSGDYPTGHRIPSEPQLAKDYGIGRPTVRQAIDVLVRQSACCCGGGGRGPMCATPIRRSICFPWPAPRRPFTKGIAVEVELLAKNQTDRRPG